MIFPGLHVDPEVQDAVDAHRPVVALETAVVTHGLLEPQNLEIALRCQEAIRRQGAVPATVGMFQGQLVVGLSLAQLSALAADRDAIKVSRRDLARAQAMKLNGGTTVASTLIAAEAAGIAVFATGGIGGVHRNGQDVSADLPELAKSQVAVVCSGVKSILNIPATLEWLETYGVPVLGFRTKDFPAFFARESGQSVGLEVSSLNEAARIIRGHWQIPRSGAVLLAVPCPGEAALSSAEAEGAIERALQEANSLGVHGNQVTPFLLARIASQTGGRSLTANLALLENNAATAACLAVELSP
jgi:pseudouridine-5'-phosphate glycosidase